MKKWLIGGAIVIALCVVGFLNRDPSPGLLDKIERIQEQAESSERVDLPEWTEERVAELKEEIRLEVNEKYRPPLGGQTVTTESTELPSETKSLLDTLIAKEAGDEHRQFHGQLPEAAWNSLVPILERGPDDLPTITSPGALTHKPLRKTRLDDLKNHLETKLAAQPDSLGLLHAFGVAQYRCDEFEDAIKTLTSFDKTADSTDSVHPISVAVQAMAHHQLEHPDDANSLLSRARELLQQERWKGDERANLFVSEAEVLIEGKLPDSINRVLDELIEKEKK